MALKCILHNSECQIDCTCWPEGWDRRGCPNAQEPPKQKVKKILPIEED